MVPAQVLCPLRGEPTVEAEQREQRLQTLRKVLRRNAVAVAFVVAALALVVGNGGAPAWLAVLSGCCRPAVVFDSTGSGVQDTAPGAAAYLAAGSTTKTNLWAA
jgi:hypothetical protein